jgi:hypothetical protein
MNPLRVDFRELYQRHLCRHGQYGINFEHFATVVGTYLAILGLIYWISAATWWAPLVPVIPYFALLVWSLPGRLFAVLFIFVACLFGLFYLLCFVSPLPIWLNAFNPILIVLLYKLQALSHRVYTLESDMAEFNKKYPKGWPLFLLLSLYELPLLLNYLVFDRQSWMTGKFGKMEVPLAETHAKLPPDPVAGVK